MTLTIPDDIALSALNVASGSPSSAEQLLLQALQAHFSPISGELQVEFNAWEQASDEDMARLNAKEGLDWI
jgi:hypothetical protein